jgi:hypothetical protein
LLVGLVPLLVDATPYQTVLLLSGMVWILTAEPGQRSCVSVA